MSQIHNVQPITPATKSRPDHVTATPSPQTPSDANAPVTRQPDRVDLSAEAQAIDTPRPATETTEIRQDLVDRVRAQIAAGAYETPEKIDETIDAIARRIDAS